MTPTHGSTLQIAPDTQLPLATVTGTLAILGIRGSGKTNTAVVLAEELLDRGQQIVVIDPTDVWWGLKSSKDGNRPGYPVVILGGKHGDIPMDEEDGATVADFIVDEGVSVILSLRHFESRADGRRFVTDVCNRLYHRKGETGKETPLMVIIDEASMFVPQRVAADEAKCVSAIQRLVRQGRASGFGVSIIDQRPATVNKDVLTQTEVLVCHRTTSPQDRKALEGWIEAHDTENQGRTFLDSLASLGKGDAWIWSPSWLEMFTRVHVRERKTFDSSRTPAPGERIEPPKKLAEIDLALLKGKLAQALERAKADDPTVLRARIAELERQSARVEPMVERTPIPPELLALEARVAAFRTSGVTDHVLRLFHSMQTIASSLATAQQSFDGIENAISDVMGGIGRTPREVRYPSAPPAADGRFLRSSEPVREIPSGSGRLVRASSSSVTPSANGSAANGATIGRTPLKMLGAMLFYERVGESTPSRAAVASFVGIRHTTGTFSNYLTELRTAKLIADADDSRITLTDKGRRQAQGANVQLPRSLAELHAMWRGKVGGTPAKMLDVLIRAYPRAIERSRLASSIEPPIKDNTGTFSNYLTELRTAGLMTDTSRTAVAATDLLFPKGLR